MERFLMQALKNWKVSKKRKPLVLWGARQVGKTWLMQEFGKREFGQAAYLSFFRNTRMQRLFQEDFDPGRIIENLQIACRTKITKENTLIILDEIQECPDALESLKIFCEELPEYPVICAGSMLGVNLHEGVSFPVGKVDELTLYPMSFREFLAAMDESGLLETLDNGDWDLISDNHERYINALRSYFFVGGMPEAVASFAENMDYTEVRRIQDSIIRQYEEDFSKHIPPNEWTKVQLVWRAVPTQLAKENRKFFFGQVKQGARMKDLENAILWLCRYGIVGRVPRVTKPSVPLASYAEQPAFKLFLSDIGLMGALSELDAETLLEGNAVFTEFKGALTEEYVYTQLLSDTELTPYYYSGEKSTYEMDFVVKIGRDVIPVEVKAEENLKSKSLKFYRDHFRPPLALRLSMSPYREQDWMKNIPLYAVSRISAERKQIKAD